MGSPRTLDDMPGDILDYVFDWCGFREIQSLRKTCHTLRNHIDDAKPDSKLTEVEVVINPEDTVVYYHTKNRTYRIVYENFENGCKIFLKSKEIFLENMENSEVALKDLALILEFQKSVLKKFIVIFDEKNFEKILKPKIPALKVQKLHLEPFNKSHVMSILPYLDPMELKKIEIYNTSTVIQEGLEQEIVKLEQWKGAEIALIYDCIKFNSILDFSHFSEGAAVIEEFSLKDLVKLKETFFQSPNFKVFNFEFKSLTDWSQFLNLAGAPCVFDEYEKVWYFRTQLESNWILEITKDNQNAVEFKRVQKDSMSKEAEILDFDKLCL